MRKIFSLTSCLLALVFACAASFVAPVRAQSGAEPEFVAALEESFILYQNEKGETACRPATPEERARLRAAAGTHVIYRGAPLRRVVSDYGDEVLVPNAPADYSGVPLRASAGLTIVLQGTAQLDANPAAKNAFIAAANSWESIISTPVIITLSVDYGPNFFDEGAYPNPGILGQTGSFVIKSNGNDPTLSTVRGRLISNSNATPAELALYNALPTGSIPVEFDGSTLSVSNIRVNTSQARALGFNVGGDGIDAQIGFNSNFGSGGQFDFDPSDGITAGFTDFDAVVLHEIGHALGFVSANGSSSATVLSIWDLFRFRPGAANSGNFGSAPRVLTRGGSQVMFGNFMGTYGSQELALSTGGPDGSTTGGGDGEQSSHWKDDSLSPGSAFIGIMDPTARRSVHRSITENDIRAIDLLGYSVVFDPQRPANDNFANSTGLAGTSGGITGTNVWATREAGELSTQLNGAQATFVGDKSVWFNWTSPTTGTATFTTAGSNFDTTLGVYTGDSVSTVVTPCFFASACQNDDAGTSRTSTVQFNTTAGTVYRINVDGWNSEHGTVVLSWTSTGTTPTPTPSPTPTPTPTPTPSPTPTPVSGRFNVVGRVSDANGNGVAGVRVGISGPTLPNGLQYPVLTTDATGSFTIHALPVESTYTVAPLRDGQYAFSPESRTVFNASPGVNIGLNDFVTSPGNPNDGSAAFVTQHYRDFLGREPDSSGLSFWTSEIEQCLGDLRCREMKRVNVSAAFFQSIEFQNTGYLVERMYKVAYGDRTEGSTGLVVPVITRAEFLQDAPLIGEGVIVNVGDWQFRLEGNKTAYAQTFVQRQRFTDTYGGLTPAQFVDRFNANAGQVLTGAERAALIDALAANNTGAVRASVLRTIAEHAELDRREKNRAFVLMQYFGYLRRNPSDAPEAGLNFGGWNFWLGKLNEFNGDFVRAEMVKAFLDSTEYRQRFGP
ncbi:MAG: NF038122 family metalloprotease [Pyrinomonadaceae bacterium]